MKKFIIVVVVVLLAGALYVKFGTYKCGMTQSIPGHPIYCPIMDKFIK